MGGSTRSRDECYEDDEKYFLTARAVPQWSRQPLKAVNSPLLELFSKAWVTIWQDYSGEDSYNTELAEADGLGVLSQYRTPIFLNR